MDSALLLSVLASHVTLITINPELRGEQVLIDRIAASTNITVMTSTTTAAISGTAEVTGLAVTQNGKTEQLSVNGIFVEVGYVVDGTLVGGLTTVDERHQIMVHPADNTTSVPGLFAAGNITTITQKQVVISAGEGAKAGLGAVQYLAQLRGQPTAIIDWTHAPPMHHQSPPPNQLPSSQRT